MWDLTLKNVLPLRFYSFLWRDSGNVRRNNAEKCMTFCLDRWKRGQRECIKVDNDQTIFKLKISVFAQGIPFFFLYCQFSLVAPPFCLHVNYLSHSRAISLSIPWGRWNAWLVKTLLFNEKSVFLLGQKDWGRGLRSYLLTGSFMIRYYVIDFFSLN